MRPIYTISILLAGMGLPVLAASSTPSKISPLPSSKSGTRCVPPTAPAPAAIASSAASNPAPKSGDKKPWLVITPRIGRASNAITYDVKSTALTAEVVLAKATSRLARVTAYWACEGDYYTRHGISATGVHLHDGHCAVDPNIIPYGSVVEISGVGKFLAVDTGSAVVARKAARQGGHNSQERGAIVVDLYFASRAAGERFAANDAKYCAVSWWAPGSSASQTRVARSLFAEEDWSKIQSKQL